MTGVTGLAGVRRRGRRGALDASSALSALRSAVGAGTWASPAASWRTFGLGRMGHDPGAELIGRLFGVRDLALARAIRHPTGDVRLAALRAGILCDAVDVGASLIALRRGAPRASGVLVGGGAALFVALGLLALGDERARAQVP